MSVLCLALGWSALGLVLLTMVASWRAINLEDMETRLSRIVGDQVEAWRMA